MAIVTLSSKMQKEERMVIFSYTREIQYQIKHIHQAHSLVRKETLYHQTHTLSIRIHFHNFEIHNFFFFKNHKCNSFTLYLHYN